MNILPVSLFKLREQRSTKQHVYSHLHPNSKTIQVRFSKFAEHCWRSKDGLISEVFPSASTYGHTSAGRPGKYYIHPLHVDTGCRLEDLQWAMGIWDSYQVRGKESQGNPYSRHTSMMIVMMMMMMMDFLLNLKIEGVKLLILK